MSKKFTIITVVKNNAVNICCTIESVLFQKFKNYEYIIVDGFSDDGTSELIQRHYKNNKNLKYFRYRDTGIYDALNFALKKATGKYIGIIHSGDIYYSDVILKNISKKTKNRDFLFGNIEFFNNELEISRSWKFKTKKYNEKNFYKIAHPSLFIKKKIAIQLEYDTKNKISSDSKFIIDLLKKSDKYFYLNYPIQFMNSYGLSNNIKFFHVKMIEDFKILYQKYNFLFLYIYIKKVLSKVNHVNLIKKKSKHLSNQFFKIEKKLNKKKILFHNHFFKKKIFLLKNIKKISYKKNFIFSALNLAYLGSLFERKVFLHKNLYHWPDGLYAKKISNKKIEKLAGRNFVREMVMPKYINKIIVGGNLSIKAKNFLQKKFKKKMFHLKLPYSHSFELAKKFPKIKYNEVVFLTISTPKQEQIAHNLMQLNDKCKVFCVGGAIEIIAGTEKEVPLIMEQNDLEGLWRLRFDTLRRIIRLISTYLNYSIGRIKGFYKNLKIEEV